MVIYGHMNIGTKLIQFVAFVRERIAAVIMKHVSVVSWFVGLSFLSLFIFFLSSEARMSREKKRLNYADLEDHVTQWCINQVELLRAAVDEINDDSTIKEQQRLIIFDGIACQFEEILELMSKINHDSQHIFDWVNNFVGRYKIPDLDLEN